MDTLKHLNWACEEFVSMYGKLNEDIDMWVGDFCPIVDAIAFDEKIMEQIWIDEAFIEEPSNWVSPYGDTIVSHEGGLKVEIIRRKD